MNPFLAPLAPTFEAALRDVTASSPRFRAAAAARLSDPPRERRDEALGKLVRLLDDPIAMVRESAVAALGELGAKSAVVSLKARWNDVDPGVRQAAVVSVAQCAHDAAVSHLTKLVEDDRPEVRATAVTCLAQLGRPETAPLLIARLDDPLNEVRVAAAVGLASLGRDEGTAVLTHALTEPFHAFDAAVALGDAGAEHAKDALLEIARGWRTPPFLRAAVGRALATISHPEGASALRKVLRSWRTEARSYAVQIVGELALTELAPDVRRLANKRSRVDKALLDQTLAQLTQVDLQSSE